MTNKTVFSKVTDNNVRIDIGEMNDDRTMNISITNLNEGGEASEVTIDLETARDIQLAIDKTTEPLYKPFKVELRHWCNHHQEWHEEDVIGMSASERHARIDVKSCFDDDDIVEVTSVTELTPEELQEYRQAKEREKVFNVVKDMAKKMGKDLGIDINVLSAEDIEDNANNVANIFVDDTNDHIH